MPREQPRSLWPQVGLEHELPPRSSPFSSVGTWGLESYCSDSVKSSVVVRVSVSFASLSHW